MRPVLSTLALAVAAAAPAEAAFADRAAREALQLPVVSPAVEP